MSQRKTRKTRKKPEVAPPNDNASVEAVDANEATEALETASDTEVLEAAPTPAPAPAPATPASPPSSVERPTAGLSTSNFPLAGSRAVDSQAPKQPASSTIRKTHKQLFYKDEIGPCTVRLGHLSGEEQDLRIPIDQLGHVGCEYVVQFRREAGPSLPVASVPPSIGQILRRQSSASRNFAFHLA